MLAVKLANARHFRVLLRVLVGQRVDPVPEEVDVVLLIKRLSFIVEPEQIQSSRDREHWPIRLVLFELIEMIPQLFRFRLQLVNLQMVDIERFAPFGEHFLLFVPVSAATFLAL